MLQKYAFEVLFYPRNPRIYPFTKARCHGQYSMSRQGVTGYCSLENKSALLRCTYKANRRPPGCKEVRAAEDKRNQGDP